MNADRNVPNTVPAAPKPVTPAPASQEWENEGGALQPPQAKPAITTVSPGMSLEDARQIGNAIGIRWDLLNIEEFRRGLEVEREHGLRDPQTNVSSDNALITAKIAWAHLKEVPDYYTRLDRMESEARADRTAPPTP